ncbi:MAG: hypothetical protein ACJA1A_001113 [Saprospiraceae bacterium]|jgi:hypothetical protein
MKNILFILLLLISHKVPAEKYALIIAVGDYPDEGKWPDISSTNDVIHIEATLAKLGFSEINITKILDAQATREGILTAFSSIQDKLRSGDIVYIHFSGHGQQIVDQNGDEIDLLDEAIVPYDSPLLFEAGVYEGERLIRDDELGTITTKMREKCGSEGQLILILDSCHSGTGVRGMGKVRGTDKIMGPDNFRLNTAQAELKQNMEGIQNSSLAPIASFYGASPRELNYETRDEQLRPVGSLSYAITSVLSKMSAAYTFEEVFDRVKMNMKSTAPRQNPQYEGPTNIRIFDGSSISIHDRFKVSKVLDKQTLKVDMGTISDVYPGTTVELFSLDAQKIIGTGIVTQAMLTSSIVQLDIPSEEIKSQLLQVRINEKSFAPMRVGLTDMLQSNSAWRSTIEGLYKLPIVKKMTECPDIYAIEKDGELSLETKDGQLIYKEVSPPKNTKQTKKNIINVLRAYTQSSFLRSYNYEKSAFDFSLRINSVDCNNIKSIKSQNPEMVTVGDCVQFEIANDGISGAYFSLLDIQPDNLLNLVIPAIDLGYTADEYYLEAGETYTTNYSIEIAQPLGEETLKLVLSKNPLQLHTIISTQGRSTRGIGDMSNFEKIMVSTYNTNTRGSKTKRNPVEEVGTKTIFFNIVEK